MGELRESKKRATRQRLSDVATKLFYERGFDAVTVDEIAAAAGVSKMTVFNYFARKEDLLLDREDEVEPLLRAAIAERPRSQSPVRALRRLIDRLVADEHPFVRVDRQTVAFWHVVLASPALKARLREMSDQTVEILARLLADGAPDGRARLAAGTIVLTWRTAYGEAIDVFEAGGSARRARAAFLTLVDDGFAAAERLAAKPR